MNNRRILVWLVVGGLGLVLAQAVQRQLNLVVNGQAQSSKAIVVGGQTYVPVSALRALGVTASVSGNTVNLSAQAAGGADQRASLEGCLNEWLSNGIWRARATRVEPFDENGLKGWAIDFEVRNATNRTLEAWNAGFKDPSSLTLAFASGATERMEGGALARESYEAKIYNAAIPQGAAVTTKLKFRSDRTDPPTKLLIEMDTSNIKQKYNLAFSTPNPSLRFKLDCSR
ncbi:MAG: hypothetical protein RMK51_07510 [Meiothermus sp.]|uniref:hypothetical protein n=1 Tax=Meiothermus sp. TaxID=1955249 RepID=UPI0025E51659|nr:hypothetical protein [Meiothermus sp.]MCS7068172.1 hypothetical protein [Meiothermus sp.]MDW8425764.1 hypothetical protein [Meiothermus sp.]